MSTNESSSPGGHGCRGSQGSVKKGEIGEGNMSSKSAGSQIKSNANFGSQIEYSIKSSGSVFVKENTGNIKDYYKISSCIGRGK